MYFVYGNFLGTSSTSQQGFTAREMRHLSSILGSNDSQDTLWARTLNTSATMSASSSCGPLREASPCKGQIVDASVILGSKARQLLMYRRSKSSH